jgi:hypothetical protein
LSVSKIFNDPVYGFITVSDRLILQLIEHPYFQRLRRISQLGLSCLVYPGANHTRFHHALGAMHLMQQALDILKAKGTTITDDEYRSAQIAILLHDIGHGPFSHTLENNILENINHESLSLEIIKMLNDEFSGELEIAIQIFSGTYHKHFLHQLVSSQLDIDRLDYLMRDSFYTGVAEGVIGSERIIKMMYVFDDQLVIEEKGIYSLEKFLIARRLMYWQVYLHKTVLSADILLTLIMQRAKFLASIHHSLECPRAIYPFINKKLPLHNLVEHFTRLDDFDVLSAVKEWCYDSDFVLSNLCKRLINRNLFKVKPLDTPPEAANKKYIIQIISNLYSICEDDAAYFIKSESIKHKAYDEAKGEIMIYKKNGELCSIFEASTHLQRENLTQTEIKHLLFYPKEIKINEICC